jgi:hypothetical protein
VPADPLDTLAGALAQARHAIGRIAAQRDVADRRYGAVVVEEAQLRQILRSQQYDLDRTRTEIERARELALLGGETARAEGLDATPYEQTAAGLQRELAIVDAASTQLIDAAEACRGNVARARALLHDSQARLDSSLSEQLILLGRLERLAGDARTRPPP